MCHSYFVFPLKLGKKVIIVQFWEQKTLAMSFHWNIIWEPEPNASALSRSQNVSEHRVFEEEITALSCPSESALQFC